MIFILKEDKAFNDSSVIKKGSELEYITQDKVDGMVQVKFIEYNLEKVFWVNKDEVELCNDKKINNEED
jgi:hypothetical protein